MGTISREAIREKRKLELIKLKKENELLQNTIYELKKEVETLENKLNEMEKEND